MYFNGMETTCDTLVSVWLKDKKFLCGNEISIADLLGACELEQPSMYYNMEFYKSIYFYFSETGNSMDFLQPWTVLMRCIKILKHFLTCLMNFS